MKTLILAGMFAGLLVFSTSHSWAKPNKVVLGYSASWFDGIYPPESYNYGAFTHIARSFLAPKANGDITVSSDFWNPELEKLAHSHQVKLMASVGGAEPDATNWLDMARDPKAERHFFDELEKMIAINNYDGVDIDWEPSALTDPDQATYTQFMKDLRARFPKWIITSALVGGEWWAQHVSWSEIIHQVDFINLMTYDFAGEWAGHSGHNANLYPPQDSKVDDGGLNIDEIIKRLERKYAVPANKIALGLPFYGQHFFTAHMGDAFTNTTNKMVAEINYYEIAPLLTHGDWKLSWDDGAQAPYMEKMGETHTISYDDPKSIGIKCDYALKQDLRGVMIWNLGADVEGEHTPLLDSICKAFATGSMPMPSSGLSKSVSAFVSMTKEAYGKLKAAHGKLTAAGKTEEAKAFDPGQDPDLTIPDSTNVAILGKRLWELQYALSSYNRKLEDSQKALDSIPAPDVSGKKIRTEGNSLLIDDFESGGTANVLGGGWSTDCDHNNLGTLMNPMPFRPEAGGCLASPKFAAHIYGHYGKSIAPWPYTQLNGTLDAGGGAVDLSDFKTLQFWTKGDGKDYSVLLARAAVQDYANPRADFKASTQWSKVILNLVGFKQPKWGRQIPPKLSDIIYISYTPAANFSDDDFNLWVDEIAFVK